MSAKYSQEEIEKKRLLALEKRKEAALKNQTNIQPNAIKKLENVQGQSKTCDTSKPLQRVLSNFKYNGSTSSPKQKMHGWEYKQHNFKSVTKSPKMNNRYQPIETNTFFNKKSVTTAKLSMISNERFTIEMSNFIPAVIELFKKIPSKLYDTQTKRWNFHLNDYENVIDKLAHSESGISMVPLPRIVLQTFKKKLSTNTNISNTDFSCIDPELTRSLMPFQREGICFGISRSGRCIIADDMGLGKTIQALGIAHHFKCNWPLLIVTPSSVRYQWSEAIYKFLPSVPAQYIHQFTSTKDFIEHEKITIVSYDLLVRAVNVFEKHIFGFVILDESHVLKSSKTARYKAAERVARQARHVVLLSGTPALSRPIELYSQINLIMPKFMAFTEYGVRYCNGKKTGFGWDVSGSSNMLELQLFLKATCMIRRLKSEVLTQLPSKIRQVIMLDPALIKAGTKQMQEMSKNLQRKAMNGVERHSAMLQYYSESSVARLKAVCNYISDLLEARKKCLVFAHHQNVLDAITDIAVSMKVGYIRIDGKTSPEERKNQIDEFQENDNCIVAILSITAANAGVTLTAAHLVVFAELFWNPGILSQAEDRVHRIGQNSSVLIHYLVAKQTVDDYLWPLIQEKMNVLNEVGLDQNFSLKDAKVTQQEIDEKHQKKIDSVLSCPSELLSQRTIESFFSSPPKQSSELTHKTDSMTDSDNKRKDVSNEGNELKDLLELSADDFDDCDWGENL